MTVSSGTAASASITPAEAIHFAICARALILFFPEIFAFNHSPVLRIRAHIRLHLQIVEQAAIGVGIGIGKHIMVLIQCLQIADRGARDQRWRLVIAAGSRTSAGFCSIRTKFRPPPSPAPAKLPSQDAAPMPTSRPVALRLPRASVPAGGCRNTAKARAPATRRAAPWSCENPPASPCTRRRSEDDR